VAAEAWRDVDQRLVRIETFRIISIRLSHLPAISPAATQPGRVRLPLNLISLLEDASSSLL
jgi:hypothetical protein